MLETIHRQWRMLHHLPRHPKRMSSAELTARLVSDGYEVTQRTVQRDLIALSQAFPLVADDNRPRGWAFAADARPTEVPGLSSHEAMALRLAEAHLEHLLPPASRRDLHGHFQAARAVLDTTRLRHWAARVAVAPTGLATAAPHVEPGVLETIYDGLLEQRVIAARYRRRGDEAARPYRLHPLGLVYRDNVGYLLAMNGDYSDVLQHALHRFEHAALEETPARELPGFDAQTYARSDAMAFVLSDAPLALALRLDAHAGARLAETPLSDDQQIETLADGALLLRATVADTRALRTMLLGFGPLCEVVEPPALRQEIAAAHRAAASRYELS